MRKIQRVLVTGGAGFIGSALCRYLVNEKGVAVCNVDALTYAGVPASLREIEQNELYRFEQCSVKTQKEYGTLLDEFKPDTVMHLAAESHVDRSIDGLDTFIQTNIVGTYAMLEGVRGYWGTLTQQEQTDFRFLSHCTMRSMVLWVRKVYLQRKHRMIRVHPIRWQGLK